MLDSREAAILGMTVIAISTIFFIAMLIIAFVQFLRDKPKDAFTRAHIGLLVGGLLLSINNYILDIRVLSTTLTHRSMVVPHVWVNYVLLAVILILFVLSHVRLQSAVVIAKCKVLYFLTVLSVGLCVFFYWQWSFFGMV